MVATSATMTERLEHAGLDAEHPWPGLKAFTEDLQEYFHGRAEEADDLFRRVRRKQLTILFGQSGLGKTSLLQAGLFPKLRGQGFLPALIRLSYDDKGSANLSLQVKSSIRQTLEAAGAAPATLPDPEDSLWVYFHRAEHFPQAPDGKPLNLVLVFDQLEEFFTLGRNHRLAGNSAGLIEELADLVENRPPEALARRFEDDPELVNRFAFDRRDFRVLLCLREDYLPDLEGLRPRLPSLGENRMRLVRMNGARALEAVLQSAGRLLSADVAQRIVRFVAGADQDEISGNGRADAGDLHALEIEPWLLSLVCFELNERRLEQHLPQITAELVAGSTKDILANFYHSCLERRGPAIRGPVREFIEERLLSKTGFRESMALDTAQDELTRRGAPPAAIDELVKERLLHVEQRLGAPRVELAHDKLAEAIRHSRDERRRQEADARALAETQAAAREQVRQAEESTRKAREKLRRSRVRLIVAVACLVGLVGVLMVTGLSLRHASKQWTRAENEKEQVEKLQKAAEATSLELKLKNKKLAETIDALKKAKKSEGEARHKLTDTNYKQAIALAHREWLNGNVNKWEELLTGCQPSQRGWEWHYLKSAGPRELFSLRESQKSLHAVAFSKNGRWLASAGWDGVIYLRHADTGKLATGKRMTHNLDVNAVAFSPDSRYLASAGLDQFVKIWDPETGEEVARFNLSGPAFNVVFSQDGKKVVSLHRVGGPQSKVGQLTLWDRETKQVVWQKPTGAVGFMSGLAFDPRGRFVVCACPGPVSPGEDVLVLDVEKGEEAYRFEGFIGKIYGIAFNHSGRLLAAGGQQAAVQLWDLEIASKSKHLSASDLSKAALIHTLRGHHNYVTCIAFSSNNKHLASASWDQTVKLWDLHTGEEAATFRGHTNYVQGISFSANGSYLASVSYEGGLNVWDLSRLSDYRELDSSSFGSTSGAVFEPNGKFLFLTSFRGVQALDVHTGRLLFQLPHTFELSPVAVSSDGKLLAAGEGSYPGSRATKKTYDVLVWELATRKRLAVLKDHTGQVFGVAFHPKKEQLASAGEDKTVKIWDARNGRLLRSLAHDQPVWAVAYSPNGDLATASKNGTVLLWNADTGTKLCTLGETTKQAPAVRTEVRTSPRTMGGHQMNVEALAFDSEGKRLASGGGDTLNLGELIVWDMDKLEPLYTVNVKGHITGLAFHKGILAVSTLNRTVSILDADSGQELLPPLVGQTMAVNGVAFSPDGRHLVSTGARVIVWDALPTGEKFTLRDAAQTVNTVAISRDEKWLVSGGNDKIVRIWDCQTGKLVRRLKQPKNIFTIAFSPDGKHIAFDQDPGVKICDMAGEEVIPLPPPPLGFSQAGTVGLLLSQLAVSAGPLPAAAALFPGRPAEPEMVTFLAFSPVGQTLAVARSDHSVTLFDTTTWKVQKTMRGHADTIFSMSFGRDGKQLATGSKDKTIIIWDVATGKKIKQLHGHEDSIQEVSFHANGRHVASGSKDKTVRVWDIGTGKHITLEGHLVPVWSVAFHPTESKLVSTDEMGIIKVWDSERGEELAGLRAHSGSISYVIFGPRGGFFATAGRDGTVRLWDLEQLSQGYRRDSERNRWLTWYFKKATVAESMNWSDADFLNRQVEKYATTAGPELAKLLVGRGNALRIQGDYDKAIADYDRAILRDPTYFHAYNDRGITWFSRRKYDKAVVDFTKALELFPKNKIILTNRGDAWRDLGKNEDKALADYDEALRIDPNHAVAYNNRGILWYRQKQYERAIDDYSAAIRLNPMSALYYRNRGDAYTQLRHFQKALADDDKAVQLDPNDPVNFINRGVDYRDLKKYREAIADFSEAIRLNPQKVAYYRHRSNAYVQLQEYEKALADDNKAVELDPKDPVNFAYRGLDYRDLKKYKEAIADFSEAIRLDPKYAYAYDERGLSWFARNQHDKAIADLGEAIRLSPKTIYYYRDRGAVYTVLGQAKKALADDDTAAALPNPNFRDRFDSALLRLANKDTAGYRARCADILEALGKQPATDSLYWAALAATLAPPAVDAPFHPLTEKSLAGDAKNGDYLLALGAVLYRTGKFQEAIKRLTEAEDILKRLPNPRLSPAHGWFFLAMAHHRLGHSKEAAHWLDQAMAETGKNHGPSWIRKLTLDVLATESQKLIGR